MDMTMNRSAVHSFLEALNGKIFSVDFIKRSTGEKRTMRATTNYRKHLAGGEAAYDFSAKSLIPVWDLDKKAFRSIPTDSVMVIRALGATITVRD